MLHNILEATTTERDYWTGIAKMTLDDYLEKQNTSGKMHPDDSYAGDLKVFNPDYTYTFNSRYRDVYHGDIEISENNSAYFFEVNGKLANIYDKSNGTLYYTVKPLFADNIFVLDRENKYQNIPIEDTKRVKYMSDIIGKFNTIVQRNMTVYNNLLGRKIINGERFIFRSEGAIKKDEGTTIAVFNEKLQIVASASNEWGATLIHVAEEYRGYGIGIVLGKIWYNYNPSFESGGYTASGKKNATKMWVKAVKDSLSKGLYSDYIRNGEMTMDEVMNIVQTAKAHNVRDTSKFDQVRTINKIETPLVSTIDGTSVIIFDKRAFEIDIDDHDAIEDCIYAHGFIRDDAQGNALIYSLDYVNEKYRRAALYSLLQLSREGILVSKSDMLGNLNIPHTKLDDDLLSIEKDVIDLNSSNTIVNKLVKKFDPYYERFDIIHELAHSKWPD